jgi:hypothetical protein
MTRARTSVLAVVMAVIAVAAVAAAVVVLALRDDDPPRPDVVAAAEGAPVDHDVVIPLGTGERIDAGEPVEIIPAELEVHVGESLRIVNDDDRAHVVGPFYVGVGETVHQTFTSPGELSGDCSAHPSGRFVLTVVP